MENEQKQGKERVDSEILFSKTVKAGKRIYYIDVKKDRKGELYLSLTESKRLKEQGVAVSWKWYEKSIHIFFGRWPFQEGLLALEDAAAFLRQHQNKDVNNN